MANFEAENLPVWFGGVHGQLIGTAAMKEDDRSTRITIDLDHPDRDHIANLLNYDLIGFAAVLRPAPNPLVPSKSMPEERMAHD